MKVYGHGDGLKLVRKANGDTRKVTDEIYFQPVHALVLGAGMTACAMDVHVDGTRVKGI